MRYGKTHGRLFLAATVAAVAAVLVCLIVDLALPSGTESRYVLTETYSGIEGVNATPDHDHSDETWVDLNAYLIEEQGEQNSYTLTISSPSDGYVGYYYLSGDLTCRISFATSSGSDGRQYTSAAELNLCLNGHALSRDGTDSVICLGRSNTYKPNTVLNIYDCCGAGDGGTGDVPVHCYRLREDGLSYDFSDPDMDPEYPSTYDGYVRGGLITGGNAGSMNHGGGILNYGCVVNMYGGTVAGNVASSGGGGVCCYQGEFNMYGGSVSGNRVTSNLSNMTGSLYDYGGGGIFAYCYTGGNQRADTFANVRIHGGEIRDNYCANYGGGVAVNCGGNTYFSASFEMYGGTIEGNYSRLGGGGVSSYHTGSSGSDSFLVADGEIRDNTAMQNGGGIFLESDYVVFEMTGGRVTGNVQETIAGDTTSGAGTDEHHFGGGIDFYNDTANTVTIGGTAYVYGNWCAGKTCNVGIAGGHYITLGDLEAGARIGVTLESPSDGAEITANYVSGAESFISSDDRSYRVTVSNTGGYLVLKKRS